MTLYNVLFLIHILAIVAAFGPALVYPVLARQASLRSGAEASALAALPPVLLRRFSIPALLVAAVAGMGLVGTSEGMWDFSDTWVSLSFTLVILLLADAFLFLRPAARSYAAAVAQGDTNGAASARSRLGMATGLFHLGFLLTAILMIWKPGV